MKQGEVSVEAAMKRGRFMLKTVPTAVLILFIIGSPFISARAGLPVWIGIVGFLMSFPLAWLTWSILVTRWRIWALHRVRNTQALLETAVGEKLIWPDGSWFERTEIRTAEQRSMLEALHVRLSTPDLWKDDPEVSVLTEIHWSRMERVVTIVIVVGIIGLCSYVIFKDATDWWAFALILFFVIIAIKDIKKLSDRRAQIRIDDHGITLPD